MRKNLIAPPGKANLSAAENVHRNYESLFVFVAENVSDFVALGGKRDDCYVSVECTVVAVHICQIISIIY